MDYIQTNEINNNNLIRSFAIGKRSVDTLFFIGEYSIQSSIRKIEQEHCCPITGEYFNETGYYIDEDIAYFGYKRIINKEVREHLLPCYLRLLEELTSINNYTRENSQRISS